MLAFYGPCADPCDGAKLSILHNSTNFLHSAKSAYIGLLDITFPFSPLILPNSTSTVTPRGCE